MWSFTGSKGLGMAVLSSRCATLLVLLGNPVPLLHVWACLGGSTPAAPVCCCRVECCCTSCVSDHFTCVNQVLSTLIVCRIEADCCHRGLHWSLGQREGTWAGRGQGCGVQTSAYGVGAARGCTWNSRLHGVGFPAVDPVFKALVCDALLVKCTYKLGAYHVIRDETKLLLMGA
jgi:hypothetical protein